MLLLNLQSCCSAVVRPMCYRLLAIKFMVNIQLISVNDDDVFAAITIVGTVFPAKRPRPPKAEGDPGSKAAHNGAPAIAAINTKED